MQQYRQTPQRREILRIMQESESPVTAEQVYEQAVPRMTRIALTTVYRNLESLAQQGIVQRSVYDDGVARYQIAAEHRHFLVCMDCKRAVALSVCPFEQLEDHLSEETGYLISEHKMEFFGYCPACRKKHGS